MLQTLINKLSRLFRFTKEPVSVFLLDVLGFSPKEEKYYHQALTHRSIALSDENNERLEFLGDSVLESMVSDYLYKYQEEWTEGELTAKRSEWVSRTTNNTIAERLGLMKYIKYNKTNIHSNDMLGNALEALIGAIFLDYGYDRAYAFFLDRMLPIILSLEENQGALYNNYKSQLLEYAQQKGLLHEYQAVFVPKHGRGTFRTAVAVGDCKANLEVISEGRGKKKKEAEQEAARLAMEHLLSQ